MASLLHFHASAVLMIMMLIGSDAFQAADWTPAFATFYGDSSGLSDDMGGACGYANFASNPYTYNTAALSTPLFNGGKGCGGCYEIRCQGSPHCLSGAQSVTVTGTNLCPPNYAQSSDDGGWCNPPRLHFDMAMPMFLTFAEQVAGIVPVMYRRVPCQRSGGIRFQFQGNAYWLLVFVINIGGSGDIGSVSVKGSNDWIVMSSNWGISYQAFSNLGGQALSFMLTTYTSQETITCNNVADSGWSTGMTYEASNNF
ncbi:hypothetical protein LUZ60_007384 [Juncus effusus]|nr:hypothetical protein LUZ60_007384 [Juncus effusus]